MSYSERAYFEGDHCAHCAAWEEFKRLRAIDRACRERSQRRAGR